MSTRKLTLSQACAQYPHRYTVEHIPAHVAKPCEGNGKFYAPQYATDAEWYGATVFPGEGPEAGQGHCYSSKPSWPLGQWLDEKPSRELFARMESRA